METMNYAKAWRSAECAIRRQVTNTTLLLVIFQNIAVVKKHSYVFLQLCACVCVRCNGVMLFFHGILYDEIGLVEPLQCCMILHPAAYTLLKSGVSYNRQANDRGHPMANHRK